MSYLSPPPRRGDLRQQLLDALPDATAIINPYGVITAVNRAWQRFGADNDGGASNAGVDVNYLQVCDQAAAAGIAEGAAAAVGLRAVLAGESVRRDLEYECSSPSRAQWFVVRMTPLTGPLPGALISHLDITSQRTAEQELRHSASHDSLTGLPNRALLLERLSQALTPRAGRTQKSDVGLLLLDLDKFKRVNDTYGHHAGDEALKVIAHRLQSAVRSEDTVARLGGDEFVVLAPRIASPALTAMTANITQALAPPQVIDGQSLHISAYLASAGSDAAAVLMAADAAMFRDKNINLPR